MYAIKNECFCFCQTIVDLTTSIILGILGIWNDMTGGNKFDIKFHIWVGFKSMQQPYNKRKI